MIRKEGTLHSSTYIISKIAARLPVLLESMNLEVPSCVHLYLVFLFGAG